jgi:hypothetical protein
MNENKVHGPRWEVVKSYGPTMCFTLHSFVILANTHVFLKGYFKYDGSVN